MLAMHPACAQYKTLISNTDIRLSFDVKRHWALGVVEGGGVCFPLWILPALSAPVAER